MSISESESIPGKIVSIVNTTGRVNSRSVVARRAMSRKHIAFQQGFTLFELIVVIIIVVVIMAMFFDRARFYQEQAEKTAMEGVVGSIESAMTMQFGQLVTRGKSTDLPALVADNPMNWLQKKPRNYAGEYFDPSPATVDKGNWMFDLKSRDLIYVPRHTTYFQTGTDGNNWIRFHIRVDYEHSRLPSLQNRPPQLTGASFLPVEPYSWF